MEETYQNMLTQFYRNTQNNMHILEITKCCGYSEFLFCYNESTLTEFYNNVYYQFQLDRRTYDIKLFILDSENKKYLIPNTYQRLKNFIQNNREIMKPIYPLPCRVVYRIFIDDGSCAMIKHNYELTVCSECAIHTDQVKTNQEN
jgi:hypothetical protein